MLTKILIGFGAFVFLTALIGVLILYGRMYVQLFRFVRGKEERVVMFSPLEGVISDSGEPVSDVVLERSMKYGHQEWIDSTVTGDDGRFMFGKVEAILKVPALSHFVIFQAIKARYRGEDKLIWTKGKDGKSIYDELGGRPVNFRCELTDELVRVETASTWLGTSCQWDALESDS